MVVRKPKARRETYVDLETEAAFVRGPFMESRKSKITRVNRVFNLFNELSQIEKENFINLLKNNKF